MPGNTDPQPQLPQSLKPNVKGSSPKRMFPKAFSEGQGWSGSFPSGFWLLSLHPALEISHHPSYKNPLLLKLSGVVYSLQNPEEYMSI